MSITLFSQQNHHHGLAQQNTVHKIAHSIYQQKGKGGYSSRAVSICTAPAAATEKAADMKLNNLISASLLLRSNQ